MTTDHRRHSLYVLHLAHRYYAEGGNAGMTLHRAGSPIGTRTWATYCDAHRRAESIRDGYRATGRGPAFPTARRTPHRA